MSVGTCLFLVGPKGVKGVKEREKQRQRFVYMYIFIYVCVHVFVWVAVGEITHILPHYKT